MFFSILDDFTGIYLYMILNYIGDVAPPKWCCIKSIPQFEIVAPWVITMKIMPRLVWIIKSIMFS